MGREYPPLLIELEDVIEDFHDDLHDPDGNVEVEFGTVFVRDLHEVVKLAKAGLTVGTCEKSTSYPFRHWWVSDPDDGSAVCRKCRKNAP